MDNIVANIARLIYQNDSSNSDHGLMNGNTAKCIFFYGLARSTSDLNYEKIADNLLEKVFSNLSISSKSDFEHGLSGIGWGIEYLLQNGFAEGNADEILEELDNKIFRELNENDHKSFELTTGLTGYFFYLISRLKDVKNSDSMAKRINRELLIVTINKIDILVTNQFPDIVKEINFDLFWRFPAVLFGLKEAFKLNVFNEKIICIIRQWVPLFESYIPSLHINRLFIALILNQINTLIPDSRLEKQIRILVFATDFEQLKSEVDHNDLSIRFGWPGIAWLLNRAAFEFSTDYPNYHLFTKSYFEITEIHKDQLEKLILDVQDDRLNRFNNLSGLTGIGILELLWPGVLTGSGSQNS